MTVRAWFTISAVALVLLAAAFVYWLRAPIPSPAILARVGSIRLDGQRIAACWPQRSGALRCEDPEPTRPKVTELRPRGTLSFTFAAPVRPDEGQVVIARQPAPNGSVDAGACLTDTPSHEAFGRMCTVLFEREWKRTVRYDLDPGTYVMDVQAGASDGAHVRYSFRFKVTRPAS